MKSLTRRWQTLNEEQLRIIIAAEIGKLKSELAEATKDLKDFEKDSKDTGKGVSDALTSIGTAAGDAMKAVGVAVAGASTALLAVAETTKEYRQEQAKLITTFESAGSSAEQAAATYNGLYRVLGDSGKATEASAHLAQLTTDQKELSDWATICQGVYATFGDSLPIESLTEAANETAKTGKLTGALADALNWAGVNEDDFQAKLDATTSASEREAILRETLTGLYEEAATAYEKNAAGLLEANEAQNALDDSMASLGETMEPVMTSLKSLAADVLTQIAPYLQDFADKHLPSIIEALGGLAPKVGEVLSWIADNWEVISTIGTIIAAIAATLAVLSAALTAYNTVMAITTAVSAPVIGIVAAIVAGIALLVTGIVLAVQHWDEITAAIGNFASSVAEWFSGLWDSITGWISGVGESISNWWTSTKEGFANWFNGVKEGWSNFWSGVGDKISSGVNAAKEKFNDMKEGIKERVTAIKEAVSEKWDQIKTATAEKLTAAKEKASEIWEGVKSAAGTIMQAAKDTVQEKLDNIKKAYEENGGGIKGIASAAMEGVKGYFTAGYTFIDNLTGGKLSELTNKFRDGLANVKTTVSNALNKVKESFTNILDKVKTTVSNAVQKLKDLFNFDWSLPKIKLPHFKVSGELDLFAAPPKIPSVSIEWYAKGGVFDKPTLFGYDGQLSGLGEHGAEAVVPLENNLEWLDKMASMLSEKLGNNGTPVVINVDGKTFARTAINSINQLTTQTGKLDLVIA